MKTSALRKAAKRRANGNGNGKKKRTRINPKTGRITVRGKDVSKFKSGPTPPKPNIKDFRTRKPGEPFVTDWKAYQNAQMDYRRRTKN